MTNAMRQPNVAGEKDDDRRRDDRSELRAGVEDAAGARPRRGGEQPGERLDARGVVAALG